MLVTLINLSMIYPAQLSPLFGLPSSFQTLHAVWVSNRQDKHWLLFFSLYLNMRLRQSSFGSQASFCLWIPCKDNQHNLWLLWHPLKHHPFRIEGQSSVHASMPSAVKDCRVLRRIEPTEGAVVFTEWELRGRDGNGSNLNHMLTEKENQRTRSPRRCWATCSSAGM